MNYINSQEAHPLDIDLNKMNLEINSGSTHIPYNINITNRALVITNSTFPKEIGFDISFAKTFFDEHQSKNIILPCPPLFEKSTQRFFSFSDEYITKDGDNRAGILQISYRYKDRTKELLNIQKLIVAHPSIKDVKAFTFGEEGFIHDIILQEYKAYKPTLKEVQDRVKDGKKAKDKLNNQDLLIDRFIKDGVHYKTVDISTFSTLFDDTEVIFSVLIDESEYLSKLQELNIWMFIISILGLVAILIIYKIRHKETKLDEQDRFIQSSMHEIKTPLSVINLNNQLRELESGKDEYSDEIDSAMKALKMSYDDMNFAMNQGSIDYIIETISLKEIIEDRVNYFKTIAKSNSKKILFESASQECSVKISLVELTRLIDNNISNAIKYADLESTISIKLDGNKVSFHNYGNPIKDTEKIFKKYFRENRVVGGHGLGLHIVNDIANKYSIKVEVSSDTENGTSFKYLLKCHADDI